MVMKACSTLVAFLALVSRNGMPISSAKACQGIQGCAQTWCLLLRTFRMHSNAFKHKHIHEVPTSAHLCCLIVDNLLCCQVTLVAHQQLVHIFIGISINLVQPLLDVVEALLVCDIVHDLKGKHMYWNETGKQYDNRELVMPPNSSGEFHGENPYDDSMCTPVVAACDCTEALLASRVPLQKTRDQH